MRSKASLLLMEQLVMLLVFALAAALCLQVFAKAEVISAETARKDQAVVLARNAAELLKATGGDIQAAQALGADGYRVDVTAQPETQPGLAQAEIQVFFGDELVFSLNTGWQEELP